MCAQGAVALKQAASAIREVTSHVRGIGVAVPWNSSDPGTATGNGELKQKACSDVQPQTAPRIGSLGSLLIEKIDRMSRQKQLIRLGRGIPVPPGGFQ